MRRRWPTGWRASSRIRIFVAEYNQRHGATVLLTSHYMADVEALCRRVIVIHHGRILFDGALSSLADEFAAYKTIAEAEGLHFVDASRIVKASPVDGLHLDPPENRKLALALKKVVEPLLAG